MSTVVENIPGQYEVLDHPLDSEMTLSMGPQHPSTHGVLRLDLRMDGELVLVPMNEDSIVSVDKNKKLIIVRRDFLEELLY